MSLRKNKGITLIALVITIIILLILAGITISQLTGNGLFGKAGLAKQKTRYVSAKEIIDLKLMEIQVDCEEKEDEYTIKKIAEGMKETKDITIEKYYNTETSKIKNEIEENLINLEGIVVSVDEYSEYKFLIGEERKIVGVLEGEVTDTTSKEDFINLEEFETKAFSSTATSTDNIEYFYEKKRIETNKMQILITVIDEKNGIDKIEYPNGDILQCNGKNKIAIDYTIEIGMEYVFKIKSNNGYVKEMLIYEKEKLENVYEIGQYVKYEANGYSDWIIAGENENGEIMIVSEGGTELYTLVGNDYNDAYVKLDEYCNQNYVDERYAIKAENFSLSKNVGKSGTTDIKVLYGTKEATQSELLNMASKGWFWDSYSTWRNGAVYSLGKVSNNGAYRSYSKLRS